MDSKVSHNDESFYQMLGTSLRNTKTPPTPQKAEQKHKVKRGGQYEDRHHTVRREATSEGHPRVISAQPSPGLVSSNTTHSTQTPLLSFLQLDLNYIF